MTALVQCDRCGAVGRSAIFQGVLVLTGYSVSSDSRTRRPDGAGGRQITENIIDLCDGCRLALAEFLRTTGSNAARLASAMGAEP